MHRAVLATTIAVMAFAPAIVAQAAPSGGSWNHYNKTYDGERYSPLSQITPINVGTLRETCRLQIARGGALESGPIVIDGTMFVTTSVETLAIDPTNCSVKWKHIYQPEEPELLPVNRGVAYLNGMVFRGTGDARLIALDASSGKLVWSNVVGNPSVGEYISGVPLAWNGMVIVGTAGSELGIKGRVAAFDAASGREIWRFDTIPTGKEIGSNSWRSKQWARHGGGGTWSTFALDPATAELFVPVGNPVPDFSPNDRPGANLFTDSLVVLDARNGSLRWWYQLVPHDGRDLDLAAAPMLYRDGRLGELVALAGKDGYLHVVSRTSHRLIFKTAVTTIENEGKSPTPHGGRFCPGSAGGVQWNGPAFDPASNLIIVGALDYCQQIRSKHMDRFKSRTMLYGGTWQPPKEKGTGWVTAVDATTGVVRWRYHAGAFILAGVTVTASGLVLTGDNDGNFLAFDSHDGKLLKQIPTGGSLSGGIVTYEEVGKQYIAVMSGSVSRTLFGALGRPTLIVLEAELTPVANRSEPDVKHGEEIYNTSCMGCHAYDGSNIEGFNLKGLKTRMNADQLTAWLENPAPPMPRVFPTPPDDDDQHDIRDLVAYLLDHF